MKVSIYHCLEGAKIADGVVVLFDIFRASNTIIAMLERGVDYILPIADLKDAYHLKAKNPDHLLFGERGGLPLDGFDFGNSPAKVSGLALEGKKIILTTSAGSQGIAGAIHAEQVLIGSFRNANAMFRQLKFLAVPKISLLAIGNEAIEPAVEDDECANYMQSLLNGAPYNTKTMNDRILKSDGAARLKRLHQEDDLNFCTKLNKSQIIPKFDRKTGKITSV